MKKSTTGSVSLIFLVFFLNQNLNAQSEKSFSQEIQNRITSVENSLRHWTKIKGQPELTLEERMKYYHVNGISIVVIKDFKIDWAKGYGWADSLTRRPVNTSTLFQVGSISKSLNGLAVLSLVQRGKT